MKNKFFLLVLLGGIICISSTAQPTIKKQKAIGGSGNDQLSSMYHTSDGGVVLGGTSGSNISGEKSENSRGDWDYWIVKLDKPGNIQWDKTIGGSSTEQFGEIQQTADGGYIIGGSSLSPKSGEKSANSRGLNDYWIVKLDGLGQLQWNKTFGGNKEDILHSIKQTKDGGYILGGSSNSNITGQKSENTRGSDDYWIIKLDKDGNKQWDKTIGGDNSDVLYSLVQTCDGGYFLGGYSRSFKSGEKSEDSRYSSIDYWVVKLDKNGAIQWDKTIGGGRNDELHSVQQTKDEGYVVAGLSYSNAGAEKTENNRGFTSTYDYWIVKLNNAGIIQWDKTIGGSSGDKPYSIQQTIDKGYILGGSSWSGKSGEKTEVNRGSNTSDYWVVKTDSLGNVEWDKTIGAHNSDYGYSAVEVAKNVYVAGGFSLSGISRDKTEASRGFYDYWIVQLNYLEQAVIASVEDMSSRYNKPVAQSNKGFLAYPNPAKDKINIQSGGKALYTLTNGEGKIVATQTINGNGVMHLANIPAGIYYLKNITTSATKKITITK